MNRVFVVGALHLDVVVDAPRLPVLDETLMGDSVAYRFGGKGGNQALAAARMGADVTMAGRVGQDDFADAVLAALDRGGVRHEQVRRSSGATGMSVAIVDRNGEYGAVVVSGVNRDIDPAQVDVAGADVILLQNEIPEAVNAAVIARRADARVVLNAAPARAVAAGTLADVDVVVVNRVEAAQITGVDDAALAVERTARDILAMGPRAVVLTLGAAGAVLCQADRLSQIHPPVVAQGSTHGAGDAFVGAMAAELARGCDLEEAVRFGCGAAAHFVQTEPAKRETITRTDLEHWRATL